MKRILTCAVVLGIVLAMSAPAWAATEHDKNCSAWHNDAGGKTLHMCSANQQGSDNSTWWGRGFGWVAGSEDGPYAVTAVSVIVWSRVPGSSNYCEGQLPGCNGGGDSYTVGPIYTWPNTQGTARDWTTGHYVPTSNDIRCLMHTETIMQVWWTQANYQNHDVDWRAVNSGETVVNGMNC